MTEGEGRHVSGLRRYPRSLTRILMPTLPAEFEELLESFRVEFEKTDGPTDLSRHYVTMRSTEEQEWLIENCPEAYFDAMPRYLRAWHLQAMQRDSTEGKLDLNDPVFLRLYVSGHMQKSLASGRKH